MQRAKGSLLALTKGLEDLRAARASLNRSQKGDLDSNQLRAAISVTRHFYEAFFEECYGTAVNGFGWEDKELAVEAILRGPPAAAGREDSGPLTDVASLFEDLSDVLHGDVDFGYTDDLDTLINFSEEFLEVWFETVTTWLRIDYPAEINELLRAYRRPARE